MDEITRMQITALADWNQRVFVGIIRANAKLRDRRERRFTWQDFREGFKALHEEGARLGAQSGPAWAQRAMTNCRRGMCLPGRLDVVVR